MHKKAPLVFSIACFLITGCYNNAHLRTQKQLTPEEKVFSGSGVIAIGGADENWNNISNTGVMGFRGEVSMLKGGKDSESGPYLGFGGNSNAEEFGFIAGYDYRKYTGQRSGSPKKLGAQFEVNISEAGETFHLRPSLTSTTRRGKPFYGGVHGLLAVGNLMDGFEWTTYDSSGYYHEDYEEWIDYRFNSLGAGITAGAELLTFNNNSIQLQVDVSLVKNSFSTGAELPDIDMENVTWASWLDDNGIIDEEWGSHDDELIPMVTGSIGMSFFKPGPKVVTPLEPMPTPQKRTAPFYDPKTGEEIKPEKLRFDPETGEKVSFKTLRFNPETGEEIKESVNSSSNKEGLSLAPKEKPTRTTEDVVFMAHSAAEHANPTKLYSLAGAGSCVIWPIGIPLSLLFDILGPYLPITTLETKHPQYLELTNTEKQVYKKTYKKREAILRSASCHSAQAGCGLAFLAFLFILDD